MDQPDLDTLCINTIRTLSMDAVQEANSGHPGTPMALAPLAYLLFHKQMRHAPRDPDWPDRDRFVLSAGHASMLLYSALHLSGYELTLEDIKNFRQLNSPTAGHPERKYTPGIETTTGPLGQGIATSVGIALAERMKAARFNRVGHEIVDHHTYVIASDGDLQEGVAAEASSLAGHLALGKLLVFYDDNHITIEGDTDLAFSEDVARRYRAYGWHVQDLGEDIALERIDRAIRVARQVHDKPSLIILRTHIAPGAPTKQDTAAAHGSPLGEEEIRATKEAYGWPSQEPFHVPGEVREHFGAVAERGEQVVAEWKERFEAYRAEHAELAAEFERIHAERLPDGWQEGLPRKGSDAGAIATRKASSQIIQWAAAAVPELVGGSADLGPSTLTDIEEGESVRAGDYSGRTLHFGIREHAMGAIVNGLVVSNLRAYGATFLIFSDYMRASVRLAALMHAPSIFVYTHDSIGLGEDGPTHQPIEQLPGLRAIPNLHVVRPADFNETALAWRHAIARQAGPTAFALSRQGVPTLDGVPEDAVDRGAYVLRDADGPDQPDLVLIATGAEVHVALEAADLLAADGTRARVVSAPCLEAFAEQDDAYRDSVLPPAVRARVAVEAASPLGWHRWVGSEGDVVAMESFGQSAPYKDLFAHFGFTGDAVAARARRVLERVARTNV
jgi:transketolase